MDDNHWYECWKKEYDRNSKWWDTWMKIIDKLYDSGDQEILHKLISIRDKTFKGTE